MIRRRGSSTRLSIQAPELQFEKLECRRVLASTLFVDFGLNFAGDELAINNQTSGNINGPEIFPGSTDHIIESLDTVLNSLGYSDIFDTDNNGDVSALEAQLFGFRVLAVANRTLEPFDVTVQSASASGMSDIGTTLFNSPTNDAYIVATGLSDPDWFDPVGGGFFDSYGDAPVDQGNTEDNLGFAFLHSALKEDDGLRLQIVNSLDPLEYAARASAHAILHAAGHSWGLFNLAKDLGNPRITGSIMSALQGKWGEDFGLFTRYTSPTQEIFGVPQGTGAQNSFDTLSANVGLRPNAPFYVTGTGAFDHIRITDQGGGQVRVTVQPYEDDSFTTIAGAQLFFPNQLMPDGILVEGGYRGDWVEIGAGVTAGIEARGSDDINGVPLTERYRDFLQGPDKNNAWTVDGKFSGNINLHITFSEFEFLWGGSQSDLFDVVVTDSNVELDGKAGDDSIAFPNQVSTDVVFSGSEGHDTVDLSTSSLNMVELRETSLIDGFNGVIQGGNFEFFDVDEVIGRSNIDTIQGLDQNSGWVINNETTLYATGGQTLALVDFEEFHGGDQIDQFNVLATSYLVRLYGHDGKDTFWLSSIIRSTDGNVSSLLGHVDVDGGSGLSQLVVVDTNGSGNDDVVITTTSITGIAPAGISYTGEVFDTSGSSKGVWIIGADGEPDHITIESFLSTNTLKIQTNGGDDTINSRGALPGNIMLNGGGGSDNYTIELSSFPRIVMAVDTGETGFDKLTVIGLPGGNTIVSQPGSLTRGSEQILYDESIELLDLRTGSGMDQLTIDGASARYMRVWTGADNDRVTINDTTGLHSLYVRTKSGLDRVFVNRTHAATVMTTVHTGSGGDYIYVGSTAHADNGQLNRIQGRVMAIGGGNSDGEDRLFINDRGTTGDYDYLIHPGWVVNHPDPNCLTRPEFAGIQYDGSMEVLRLDGTDQSNIFEVVPSFETRYVIDSNGGANDSLRLDVDVNSGRYLHILDRNAGAGYWSFANGFQPVYFPDFQVFNHVARLAAGADANNTIDGGSKVRVYDAETRTFLFDFYAYEPSFRGGVRVATGDINADGIPDIVTAPGRTHAPLVRVFDGLDGSLITEFMAYDPDYVGGVNIATGHVAGIVGTDIVTAPTRDLSEVRVFRNNGGGNSFTLVDSFDAYEPDFIGGVSVAVADINGDNNDDIITGSGSGRVAQVAVFDGLVGGGAQLYRFQLLGSDHLGGIFVAAGDMDGDGLADVIVGTGTNNTYNDKFNSLVHVYLNPALINLPTVFNSPQFEMQAFADPAHNLRAPIHLTVKDYDLDGVIDELFTSQGPDGKSYSTHIFQPLNSALIDAIFESDPEFSDGHYVG